MVHKTALLCCRELLLVPVGCHLQGATSPATGTPCVGRALPGMRGRAPSFLSVASRPLCFLRGGCSQNFLVSTNML